MDGFAASSVSVQIICKFCNERMCTGKKDVERLSCGFEVNINTRYSRLGGSIESLGRDFCVCGGAG